MLDRPSFVLRVVTPIVFPILAAAGHRVVVWPGHPTHTVTAYTAAGRMVRHRHVEDGALYGPLLILTADGVLEPLTPVDALRLASAG
jgi:hypothetical protein